MNKTIVRTIIESTLKSGNKSPGLFDLPKVLGIKSKLESCSTIGEVIGVLVESRSLICKSFGLSETLFNEGLAKLKAFT